MTTVREPSRTELETTVTVSGSWTPGSWLPKSRSMIEPSPRTTTVQLVPTMETPTDGSAPPVDTWWYPKPAPNHTSDGPWSVRVTRSLAGSMSMVMLTRSSAVPATRGAVCGTGLLFAHGILANTTPLPQLISEHVGAPALW